MCSLPSVLERLPVGRALLLAAPPALGADLEAGRADFLEGFLSLVIRSVYGKGPGRVETV